MVYHHIVYDHRKVTISYVLLGVRLLQSCHDIISIVILDAYPILSTSNKYTI